jgi:OOP family OmpA-OmpF porin
MRKLLLGLVLVCCCHFQLNAQKNNIANNNFDHWSIDVGAGIHQINSTLSEGYSSDVLMQTSFGVRYMFNQKFGLRLDLGSNSFSDSGNSLPFQSNLYRASLEGVLNVGNILNFQTFTKRFNLLAHVGGGFSSVNIIEPIDNGGELVTHLSFGVTPQFKLSNRISLFLNFSTFINLDQMDNFDGSAVAALNESNISYFNTSLGLNIALGKNKQLADSFQKEKRVKKDKVVKKDLDKDKKEKDKEDRKEKREKDKKDKKDKREKDKKDKKDDDDKDDDDKDNDDKDNDTADDDTKDDDTKDDDNLEEIRERLGIAEKKIADLKVTGSNFDKTSFIDELDTRYTKKGEENRYASTVTGSNVDFIKELLNRGYVNVYFDINKSNIQKESLSAVNYLKQFMNDNPYVSAALIGFTDETGGEGYNLKLSKKRAKTVYDILVDAGINPTRLSYGGVGEDKTMIRKAKQLARKVAFRIN